jgi:hypothetical protein
MRSRIASIFDIPGRVVVVATDAGRALRGAAFVWLVFGLTCAACTPPAPATTTFHPAMGSDGGGGGSGGGGGGSM